MVYSEDQANYNYQIYHYKKYPEAPVYLLRINNY